MFNKIYKAAFIILLFSVFPVHANHVNISAMVKPAVLHPLKVKHTSTFIIDFNVYQFLSRINLDFSISGVKSGDIVWKNTNGVIKRVELKNNKEVVLLIRDDSKFHDGSDLTAEDVVYTVNYLMNDKESAYSANVIDVESISALSKYEVMVKLKTNFQKFIDNIQHIAVIKRNSADNPIGSGPYYVASHSDNLDRIELKKSSYYKGDMDIDSATLFYVDKNARYELFRDGKVDLMEQVDSELFRSIKKDQDVNNLEYTTSILYSLDLDQYRSKSPFIKDHDGKVLDNNPFMKTEVRRAISLAIDRRQLADEILGGDAVASSQFVNENHPDHLTNIPLEGYMPNEAKRLLSNAGFPNGFMVTLHITPNKVKMANAIREMLKKVNIDVKVEVVSVKKYFKKKNDAQYSFSLNGMQADEVSKYLRYKFMSYDFEKRQGLHNSGRYENSVLDEIMHAADNARTKNERSSLIKQAMLLSLKDVVNISLFFRKKRWVSREPFSINHGTTDFSTAVTLLSNVEVGK